MSVRRQVAGQIGQLLVTEGDALPECLLTVAEAQKAALASYRDSLARFRALRDAHLKRDVRGQLAHRHRGPAVRPGWVLDPEDAAAHTGCEVAAGGVGDQGRAAVGDRHRHGGGLGRGDAVVVGHRVAERIGGRGAVGQRLEERRPVRVVMRLAGHDRHRRRQRRILNLVIHPARGRPDHAGHRDQGRGPGR